MLQKNPLLEFVINGFGKPNDKQLYQAFFRISLFLSLVDYLGNIFKNTSSSDFLGSWIQIGPYDISIQYYKNWKWCKKEILQKVTKFNIVNFDKKVKSTGSLQVAALLSNEKYFMNTVNKYMKILSNKCKVSLNNINYDENEKIDL